MVKALLHSIGAEFCAYPWNSAASRCIPLICVAPADEQGNHKGCPYRYFPSSRLAQRAHRRSRCNAGFYHGPGRHACADQDTNAEDYQEIIHRYVSIESGDANVDAFRLLDDLVVSEFPITRDDVDTTRRISAEQHALSARDWLHLAVMERRGVDVTLRTTGNSH